MPCLNWKAEEEEDEEDEEAVECIGKVAQSWPSSNPPKGGRETREEGSVVSGVQTKLEPLLLMHLTH